MKKQFLLILAAAGLLASCGGKGGASVTPSEEPSENPSVEPSEEEPSEFTRLTVTSLKLVLGGVEYSANDFGAKQFLLSDGAPEYSVVTDPSEAAQYVETWITTPSEVEVDGWPTAVGDYTFCVGLKGGSDYIEFGAGVHNFYVGFSIVEEVSTIYTLNSLSVTVAGETYTNHANLGTFVLGEPAPEYSVTTDPVEAAEYVDIWITTPAEVEVDGWPTVAGSYTFCVGIKNGNQHLTHGDTHNLYLGFTVAEESPSDEVITVNSFSTTINGVYYETSNWGQKVELTVGDELNWVVNTDPVEAAEFMDKWVTVESTEAAAPENWYEVPNTYIACVGVLAGNTHLKTSQGNIYARVVVSEASSDVSPVVGSYTGTIGRNSATLNVANDGTALLNWGGTDVNVTWVLDGTSFKVSIPEGVIDGDTYTWSFNEENGTLTGTIAQNYEDYDVSFTKA